MGPTLNILKYITGSSQNRNHCAITFLILEGVLIHIKLLTL